MESGHHKLGVPVGVVMGLESDCATGAAQSRRQEQIDDGHRHPNDCGESIDPTLQIITPYTQPDPNLIQIGTIDSRNACIFTSN